jgi:hypothetical protein
MIFVVSFAKWLGIEVKIAVTVIAIFFGLLYQAYVFFVPESFQENVISFLTGAVGYATLLYNCYKIILDKKMLDE